MYMPLYYSRKSKGLCVNCGEKSTKGLLCDLHYNLKHEHDRKHILKRKSEGRCIGCGAELHDEMDEGHVKCITCRLSRRVPMRRNLY